MSLMNETCHTQNSVWTVEGFTAMVATILKEEAAMRSSGGLEDMTPEEVAQARRLIIYNINAQVPPAGNC